MPRAARAAGAPMTRIQNVMPRGVERQGQA
jgi:hypothetical protein